MPIIFIALYFFSDASVSGGAGGNLWFTDIQHR